MKTDTFKTRKFMGIDFTLRKRYRAEIERLERVMRTSVGALLKARKIAIIF